MSWNYRISRKIFQVSRFLEKSPDSSNNVGFVPKQHLLELSLPVKLQYNCVPVTHLGKIRVLLVCSRGLTGSDRTESAVPGRCKIKEKFHLPCDDRHQRKQMHMKTKIGLKSQINANTPQPFLKS